MKLMYLVAAAALILGGTTFSQVTSGYYSDGAGTTAKVEVSDTNGAANPGVDVTVTDAGGSSATTGTQGSGSTDNKPTASAFKETSTPRGSTYKGANGKVYKKNAAGKWVAMRKVKAPKGSKRGITRWQPSGQPGTRAASPGNEGTSLPD